MQYKIDNSYYYLIEDKNISDTNYNLYNYSRSVDEISVFIKFLQESKQYPTGLKIENNKNQKNPFVAVLRNILFKNVAQERPRNWN